jgi:hypothetical protein
MRDNPGIFTAREASRALDIPEQDVLILADKGILPHFKDAEYYRFKKEDIVKVKNFIQQNYPTNSAKNLWKERVIDFFYFNDFYFVCAIIAAIIIWVIFKKS